MSQVGPPSESSSGGGTPVDSAVLRTRSFGGLFSNVALWGECHLGCPVWSLSVSKSGILCGCDDGSLVLLNSNMGCCFRLQEAHGSAITHISWADDGLHFLTVGTDLVVKVWSCCGSKEAECVFTMHQISPVISACFHPKAYSACSPGVQLSPRSMSNNPPSSAGGHHVCTVFVLTSDRKIGVWTDGMVEMYESISAKDSMPMSMSAHVRAAVFLSSSSSLLQSNHSPEIFLALGTKNGDLLLYSFCSESGIGFEASVSCRNKRGKFSEGSPGVGVHWVSGSELVLSTQDNRVRLIKISAPQKKKVSMHVVKKFKGHKSSGGDVPLTAFVHSAPFARSVLMVGSECGRVYVWPLDPPESSALEASGNQKSKSIISSATPSTNPAPSLLTKFFHSIKPSRAKTSTDTWLAVGAPDKLTAVVPAPWVPHQGRIAGASCAVTSSLDGSVKLFLAEYS